MKRKTILPVLLVAGLVALSAAAFAGEHKKAEKKAGEMDPEMAKYMKLSQPGDHHAHLARLAGTWDTKVTTWEAPGAAPQTSAGKAKNTMALGGRFLRVDYRGSFMGQEFEGMGLSGYDNGKKQHTDLWVDNMGTLMYPSKGSCSEGGKVLELAGQYDDPISGQTKTMKSVTRIVSDDRFVTKFYTKDSGGKEFQNMEIVYTRSKGA